MCSHEVIGIEDGKQGGQIKKIYPNLSSKYSGIEFASDVQEELDVVSFHSFGAFMRHWKFYSYLKVCLFSLVLCLML